MPYIRFILLGFLLLGNAPQTVSSKTLTLVNSVGENTEIEVDETDSFLVVLDKVQTYFQEQLLAEEGVFFPSTQLDFMVSRAGVSVRAKKTVRRDFNAPVTKQERKDITYIVTSLATDSAPSLLGSKSSLDKAGDRIRHLHPFCFLMTVFTDEKLKAGVHAIQDRVGLISNPFFDGIKDSLAQESTYDNLLPWVSEFARKLKIDPELILPALQKKNWGMFLDLLIDHIPRQINPNRYDM